MKLFRLDNWQVLVEEEVWTLEPFKAVLARDKTKGKEKAFKEIAFIFHFCDIRSDYMNISNPVTRAEEIKKGVGLPDTWKIDGIMDEAIDFYKKRSVTTIEELYKDAVLAVDGVREYLRDAGKLLKERDDNGKPITKPGDITRALKDVKVIMQDLKAAEKEVLKEKKELEGRHKGSQVFNVFEDGL